ncbi:S8 family peptidase [Pseudoalteromonas denitrificans]|uniref:Serine protease n=1 Tax=Pseudoalteromonas denitrificans DSM 6059 TaxID=1123010 RepID=A0A1I1DZV2_9GAMM|nr:S8 family peptidase [Pseudoalteromonas denitrificans]SFB78230.1 serine protease [Pseudoalteromonas denitrificans DSM 6059]
MRNNFKKQLLAIAIPAVIAATHANAATIDLNQTQIKLAGQNLGQTQFIIKYKMNTHQVGTLMNTSAEEMQASAKNFANNFKNKSNLETKYMRSMALQNHHVISVNKKMTAVEAQIYMQDMALSGNVESIELDQMLQHYATPSDPSFSSQWHYANSANGLNLPKAWDNATGAGVTVAVLDTGYRPHSDLVGNIVGGYDMISHTLVENDGTGGRDSDARDPGDAITRGECGNDANGNPYPSSDRSSSWHGTHVAGTVAAVAGNGQGGVGVAYDAKVVPVRVLGKCGGLTSDIADAIVWASGGSVSGVPSNPNPASVINMSLGGEGACSSATQTAINTARNNGAVVVVASGNDGKNASGFNPGNCSGVVNVAATGPTGARTSYSNYGSSIDVAAPGGDQRSFGTSSGILSTHNTGSTSPGSDKMSYMDGTSMAAPHIAGVAALIKQAKPSATPDEIESILKTTARASSSCSQCGEGLVDAEAAVLKAKGTTPPTGGIDVSKTNLSASKGQWLDIAVNVPAGVSSFTVSTSGGTGDMDLYVKEGSYATETSFNCKSTEPDSTETCKINNPNAGTWYFSLYAYSTFSGVSLTAK